MADPLAKRYPRELKNNLGKYLGLFLMMLLAVSFTSGFLLAAHSILSIIDDMDERYRIEDGRVICDFEATGDALEAASDLGLTIYRDFYRTVEIDLPVEPEVGRAHARVYPADRAVNLAAYAAGRAPEADDEVALDRVFCENNDIGVGDGLMLAGRPCVVSGIMTYADHQALFEDNGSFMFNALTFTVATLTDEALRDIDGTWTYAYAFTFDDVTLSRSERTDVERDLVRTLAEHGASVSALIDRADNQAIGYAVDDVEGDSAMWSVLLLLLVVIMAFVFVVLTASTIEQESAVIGTLLASGWRRSELVRHYLLLPAVVGLAACVAGLVVGVTFLAGPSKDLYYHSYSLPPYHAVWDWGIVGTCAVLPFLTLVGITCLGLLRALRFTPLQFLRHETSLRRRANTLRLSERLGYATRFRLRLVARNAGHFATLFFGILFASLLLLFGLCMLPVVENYASELKKTVVASHQYVLKVPLELEGDEKDVERTRAVRRLQERLADERNQRAVAALARLEGDDELVDALETLEGREDLTDAIEVIDGRDEIVAAVARLEFQPEVRDASRRLADRRDLVDAAERLRFRPHYVEAYRRLAGLSAETPSGLLTDVDLGVLSGADAQTMADVRLVALASEQDLADLETVAGADAATQADLETVAGAPREVLDAIELLAGIDDETREALEVLRDVDEATRADLDLADTIDQDFLDDLDAQAELADGAHLVNLRENTPEAIDAAEKYAVTSVEVKRAFADSAETVTVLGIDPASTHWAGTGVADGTAVCGRGLLEKTVASVGRACALTDPHTGDVFRVVIDDANDNEADTQLYLSLNDFNLLFGNDEDYFCAYATDTELDLDERYVASTITPADTDEICAQMTESMGDIMVLMMCMAVPIYLILVYLLTKTVIDRSARSISYMKVFGYRDREVDGLYLLPITLAVLVSLVASIPVIIWLIRLLLKMVFVRFSGNFPIIIPKERLALLVVVGMSTYALVALLHVRRIRRVPLSLAMRLQE